MRREKNPPGYKSEGVKKKKTREEKISELRGQSRIKISQNKVSIVENKLSLGNTPKGEPFGDQTKKTEHEEKNLKGVAPQVKTKKRE